MRLSKIPFAPKRDNRVIQAVAEEGVRPIDIIRAEFGEVPALIDANHPNLEKPISVEDFSADKEMPGLVRTLMRVMAFGYVKGKTPTSQSGEVEFSSDANDHNRTIFMNGAIFNPLGIAAFTALGIMILNSAIKGGQRVIEAGVDIAKLKAAGAMTVLLRGASTARMSFINLPLSPFVRSVGDVVGHENIHVIQMTNRSPRGYTAIDGTFLNAVKKRVRAGGLVAGVADFADRMIGFLQQRYFASDIEVQARLHTLLVHGYVKWGRLPQTKHELWSALIDRGVVPPDSISKELKESPEQGIQTFAKNGGAFRRFVGVVYDNSAEMNVVSDYYGRHSMKKALWHEYLPYMYGHLLELYGCKNGRAMMGFDSEDISEPGVVVRRGLEMSPPRFRRHFQPKAALY